MMTNHEAVSFRIQTQSFHGGRVHRKWRCQSRIYTNSSALKSKDMFLWLVRGFKIRKTFENLRAFVNLECEAHMMAISWTRLTTRPKRKAFIEMIWSLNDQIKIKCIEQWKLTMRIWFEYMQLICKHPKMLHIVLNVTDGGIVSHFMISLHFRRAKDISTQERCLCTRRKWLIT
jgi:hypothetical protein